MGGPRWIDTEKNLREVSSSLFVGNQSAPMFPGKWGLIVDLCGQWQIDRRPYPFGIPVLSFRLEDGNPIPDKVFEQVYDRSRVHLKRREPVLIHCAAGLSRSASMAYALLRVGRGMSHAAAMERVLTPASIERGYPMPMTIESARSWAERQRPSTELSRGTIR